MAMEEHKLDEIIRRMIWQAGVDYETRPMLVFVASAFPDPKVISYDRLLSRILSYLNTFAQSDYTIVFLAAGGTHSPSWSWIWTAYKRLDRVYRKNLKKLFIVHPTWFSKMLFSMAGTTINPKFFSKVTYIKTLSQLATHVPLVQIDIPPAVYKENVKHEKQIVLPTPEKSQMFGVPIEQLMTDASKIPRVVRDCVEYLYSSGLDVEGLFRRSPNSLLTKQVRQGYDRGQAVSLPAFGDPHIAAVLIKKFFHDLPRPVFPDSIYPTIRRCPQPTPNSPNLASVTYIRETVIPELVQISPQTLIVFTYVLGLLHQVSLRTATNKMDAHNLALCISPNLVSSGNVIEDVRFCSIPDGAVMSSLSQLPESRGSKRSPDETTLGAVVKICIQRFPDIFQNTPDQIRSLPD
ncbi:hypothetical protein BOTBODRAFT_131760 [Botryobasidium botryosum FD-172 SS1]|uniref:Rho-GAP domain-containing protein n=1 Tax=Botryobasidium botryosum (strain FD-172 SS1) TaxID=930990 RepID=A0A067MH86_BOTB1|nr:hypothetical protein BOTBODRAFT_131760 [Botryobasidium botryosum FD-172 SS1]